MAREYLIIRWPIGAGANLTGAFETLVSIQPVRWAHAGEAVVFERDLALALAHGLEFYDRTHHYHAEPAAD